VQPLPPRQAKTRLRGVHPLPPRQGEIQLRGVQGKEKIQKKKGFLFARRVYG